MESIEIKGLPSGIPASETAIFRSRLLHAYEQIRPHLGSEDVVIQLGAPQELRKRRPTRPAPETEGSSSATYVPCQPSYRWEQLVLNPELKRELSNAIQTIEVEHLVFDQWGLRQIEPNPKSALNFYGAPGTGKTMAAHAVADKLNQSILIASYAEIESKYHGDGPKNVKALFCAAEEQKAVLFIDEADSLLSKRLTQVTQGSEQAINSMRSQLLINLEQFHGVVIFSTNLVENYDKAFETRVMHLHFSMPDEACRATIWQQHLPMQLPLCEVSPARLAKAEADVCGRDIKNAVIRTAIEAAIEQTVITEDRLLMALRKIKASRIQPTPRILPLSNEEKAQYERRLAEAARNQNGEQL